LKKTTLIIGAGGVGRVVVHKCAMNSDVFGDIILASRTKSKCDEIAGEISHANIVTKSVDADNVDEVIVRKPDDNEPFTALAFKVQTDPHMGKLIYFRVYSGKMNAGSYILNATKGKRERVGRILQMHANQRENRTDIFAGDVAAAMGLDHTVTGDTLCETGHPVILEAIEFPAPVMSISVKPESRTDEDRISKALAKFCPRK
jgi:elongation factor G